MADLNAIGIDVGGSTVDAGLVIRDGSEHRLRILGNVRRIESPSQKPFEQMMNQFGNLITQQKQIAQDSGYQINVVGIAMPGPFDYENGISKMQQKFLDAYEKDFRSPLEQIAAIPVFFVNDADAFGLGVYSKLFPSEKRIFGITLGTGAGSAFVVDGKLAAEIESEQNNIPKDSEIYFIPFKEGQLEDYVSRQGIEYEYEQKTGRKLEVHEIAELAGKQDQNAVETFTAFGKNIANGLEGVFAQFKPSRIVFGGQIAKSLDLFEEPIKLKLKEMNVEVPISAAVDENYAIYGSAYYAATKLEESKA